eukprot:TRINITY_DN854_c0_g2_i4.p2 TRINITY_DN854_c0_g2~~TRINITY_DN854_c0_g2_i4.p2  ORF type:complete len:609 (-),score=128.22 TRINITY_DN854_c0_g2_i4:1798-3624(-)
MIHSSNACLWAIPCTCDVSFGVCLCRIRFFSLESRASDNHLEGEILPNVGNTSNLAELFLDNNMLHGTIPSEIGDLLSLSSLDLSVNGLEGPVPSTIGNLKNLTILNLEENTLEGCIPPQIGNLVQLTWFGVANNHFGCPIPKEIGNLKSLEYIRLRSNTFNGSIPHEIGNLTNLLTLDFSNNTIEGPIPVEFGNLERIRDIDLHGNRLNGQLPAEIANLKELTQLLLDRNNFTGTVPHEWAELPALYLLSIADNQLNETLPDLSHFKSLLRLFLQDNKMQYPVSNWEHMPNTMNVISLANNDIRDLPSMPWDGSSLGYLDLSGNQNLKVDMEAFPSYVVNLCWFDSGEVVTGEYYSFIDAIGSSVQVDVSGVKIGNFFSDREKQVISLFELRMRGSLPVELVPNDKHFLKKLRVQFPYLEVLDISENPVIDGTTNDLSEMSHLRELYLKGTSISGRFGGPLGITIDPDMTHPIENHARCFDLTGRDELVIDIEDSKFDYAHCFCNDRFFRFPPYCTPCLDHATCDDVDPFSIGMAARETNGRIQADKGYWATPSYSLREMGEGNFPTHIIPCRGVGTSHTPCNDNGIICVGKFPSPISLKEYEGVAQ